jgi:hypothetical protein
VLVTGAGNGVSRYTSGLAARWLPRLLAGAVLAASMVLAMRYESTVNGDFVRLLRAVIMSMGGMVALWIVRSGAEVRLVVELNSQQLRFGIGPESPVLSYAAIDRLTFQTPFAGSWRWLPAVTLLDDQARSWRLPCTLENGAALIEQLVRFSGRSDLESWADTLTLRGRMSRPGLIVASGYLLAAGIMTGSILYYFG